MAVNSSLEIWADGLPVIPNGGAALTVWFDGLPLAVTGGASPFWFDYGPEIIGGLFL